MITVKCKITKQLYSKDDFRIFSCVPLDHTDSIQLSKYGSFTITGDLGYLTEGNEYTLNIETDKEYNGTMQYKVISVPSLDIDVENMTEQEDLELLKQISSGGLIDVIHEAYPHYCQMILKNEPIDLKKIKGVKDFRHKAHVRLLNEKFKYYNTKMSFDYYKLSMEDCKGLYKIYGDKDNIIKNLEKNPYYCLMCICHKSFTTIDRLILSHDKKWIDSDIRCEYFIIHVLEQNELKGNTYMNAVEMSRGLDRYVIAKSKDVAIKSNMIYYDEATNNIALQNTYSAEYNIANFIIDKINNSTKLDWKWQDFKDTPNGELTDEQQNVLKEFCEHNILILDAFAGSGKSTTMFSIIQMCEYYGYKCRLLAPTGRASKRLSETTNRDAYTIHRGTGMGLAEIDDDVIIIDESSMLNLETASMVFNSIQNPNVRILFVMDIEQLPPIGLGNIAKEMVDSKIVPMCTLTKVFRFSSGGMIKTTTLARKGEYYLPEVGDKVGNKVGDKNSIILGDEKDYEFMSFNNTIDQVIDKYMEYINSGIKAEDIAILTPKNIGTYGTYNINNLIQDKVNPIKEKEKYLENTVTRNNIQYKIKFHMNDLVLVTKNNYDMLNWQNYDEMSFDDELTPDDMPKSEIFNGEIGTVVGFVENAMQVLINDEIIMFFKEDVKNLLLGYCTTIFKFQGSQIKYPIILTLNEYKGQLNKEMLYTCLSRGQKKVTEIGDIGAIQYALKTKALNNKKNQLCKLLKEANE